MSARGSSRLKTAARRAVARDWLDPDYAHELCAVTSEEVEEAMKTARRDLLQGKKPVAAGKKPHLIITIGAPGAGKSTVAEAVAAERGDGDYVTIDLDVAVKYHPRAKGMWNAPSAVTGKPTGVGLTTSYFTCNLQLEDVLISIYEDLIAADKARPRYNIVLQSHTQVNLIDAKLAGFRTTLLFVGAPLETAIQRSRQRAIDTGKFLAPTLRAQDEIVYSMWMLYRTTAAWYGLWADEFLVADNGQKASTDRAARAQFRQSKKLLKVIPLHCESRECPSWEDRLAVAQSAIDEACDWEND